MTSDNNAEIPLVTDITLDDIAAGLDSGRFTSVQLVKTFLARIKEVDHIFHSVIETNPDALRIAQELDEERSSLQKRRSILHGVPLLIKDSIVTMEMEATAGSIALLGSKPSQEASIITRLRAAGAIILGKANMSEWSGCRAGNASGKGWSPRGGQCTSPYHPNMLAAGSSTGSAVSTALGLTFAALGTETYGSLLNPAKKTNVVGLKPTTGLVSWDAVIPVSTTYDTIGPLARTVKDAAHILTHIAGKSPLDPRTDDIPFNETTMPDFAASCIGTDLGGIRIGVPRNAIPRDELVREDAFTKALRILTQAGAEIVDTDLLAAEEFGKLPLTDQMIEGLAEMKVSLPKYFESLETNPNNLRTFEDLVEYTKNEPKEENSTRGMEVFKIIEDIEPEKLKEAATRVQHITGEGGIAGAIKRHRVDVLVAPSFTDIPTVLSDIEGSPGISVPLGFMPPDAAVKPAGDGDLLQRGPNLPFSIFFYAKRYDEQTLIRVAYAFEQLTKVRNQVQPYKAPTTELRSMTSAEN